MGTNSRWGRGTKGEREGIVGRTRGLERSGKDLGHRLRLALLRLLQKLQALLDDGSSDSRWLMVDGWVESGEEGLDGEKSLGFDLSVGSEESLSRIIRRM